MYIVRTAFLYCDLSMASLEASCCVRSIALQHSRILSVYFFLGFFRRLSRLNFARQPTNACTVWLHLTYTSPGSAHHSPPSLVVRTCVLPINTNCSSSAFLHWCLVHRHSPHRAHCPGTLFPRSFVTQPSPSSSSDSPWKLIFSTIILIDSFHSALTCILFSSVSFIACAFVTVSV